MRPIFPTALHYRAARPLEVPPTTLSIVQAGRAERKIVADICCAAFRMPEPVHAMLEGTGDFSEWRQWLAYDGGRPIAAALSFVHEDMAWLGWDATLPECRGRGAQSGLIAHRVNDAVRAGCRHVTSETAVGDPSHRNYERLGFSHVHDRSTYVSPRTSRPRPADTTHPSS
jgi:GNAT superfamily N-acetyltransferase